MNNHKKKINNLFVVGAPKCATTSMTKAFESIKFFSVSNPKELNFFSRDSIIKRKVYYKKLNICKTHKEWLRSFKIAKDTVYRCDFSVSYFDDPKTPRLIKKYYPNNSKVIIVLRDPYQRSISHYLMDKKLGYVDVDFDQLLKNKNSEYYRQYIKISEYYVHVKRFIDALGSKNVLILPFSKMNDPLFLSKEIFNFLNIKLDSPIILRKENSSKISSFYSINFFYKYTFLRNLFKIILPSKLKNILLIFLFNRDQKLIPKLNNNFFLNDIVKLKKLIKKHYNIDFKF